MKQLVVGSCAQFLVFSSQSDVATFRDGATISFSGGRRFQFLDPHGNELGV